MHARTLDQIDADLNSERAILVIERRAGDHSPAATDTRRRIDELLDERGHVVRTLPDTTPRPVDAPLV